MSGQCLSTRNRPPLCYILHKDAIKLFYPLLSAPPALARCLRESKVEFVVENTWPFRERVSEPNGILNPLRIDMTMEAGALFHSHPRRKNKTLLLDSTTVDPCASSNLENAARYAGKYLTDAIERKKNKYWGSFPAIFPLLLLAMSMCSEAGSDMHALIKELVHRRVEHGSGIHSNESQHLAEGGKVARFWQRFSFVLNQTLLFRTRHHLCQIGIGTCGHPTAPFVSLSG